MPPTAARFADEYERRIGIRDRFLWKWIHNLFDAFTLSCVPDRVWDDVRETKTLLTMYVTALDDVADRYGDAATFEQGRRVVYTPAAVEADATDVDGETVRFVRSVWDEIETRLEAAPRYDEFDDRFGFDLRSVLQAMEYARLVNDEPGMANLNGCRHYGPHNMVMFPYADIDLMHSPGFDSAELGPLRSLVWDLQRMARVGNWVTTWERELEEADYSAGVLVDAIERDLFDPTDPADPEEIAALIRDCGLDEQFHLEWHERFAEAADRTVDLDTVDTDQFVEGMRTVMRHHFATQGHK